MKAWFFPIFFLIFLFSDQLLSTYLSLVGMTAQSGLLQRIFIPIAIVGYVILLRDAFQHWEKVYPILIITLVFGLLFFLSSLTVLGAPSAYYNRLLRFGSICVAGVAVGVHLSLYPCYEKIERLLPFFIILFVFVLGRYGFEASMNNMIIKEEEGEGIGLNYQSFSYYMAMEFTYSIYFLLFSSIRGSSYHRMMFLPMAATAIASAALCIMGGGRGPFVYLAVITLVLFYFYQRTRKTSVSSIWTIALLILAFVFIVGRLNVFESAGYTRVSENLTNDSTRDYLYGLAWETFKSSPIIGYGFGSIWWTVGWACHNMFLDLLAEGGVIGAGVVLYYFFITGKYLWKQPRINSCYCLILIVFLETIIENTFSGYWVSSQAIWFAVAFALTDMKTSNRRLLFTR